MYTIVSKVMGFSLALFLVLSSVLLVITHAADGDTSNVFVGLFCLVTWGCLSGLYVYEWVELPKIRASREAELLAVMTEHATRNRNTTITFKLRKDR